MIGRPLLLAFAASLLLLEGAVAQPSTREVDVAGMSPLVERLAVTVVACALAVVALLLIWNRQIRKREERFRSLIENGTDLILAFDRDGGIIYHSPSHETVLGYADGSLIETSLFDLLHPDDVAQLRDALSRLLPDATPLRIEHRIRHSNGGYRYLESNLVDLVGDPAVGAIVLNGWDVTERREMSEALRVAKDAAEAASQAKSEFLSDLSHEVRTPMNGIVGMSQLLQATELSPLQESHLRMLGTSSDILLALVDNLRDLSRIESGDLLLESAEFSLWESIDDALKLLAVQADERGIELNCRLSPEMPARFDGDPRRLRQVIANLVSHTVRVTDAGEVTLSLAAGNAEGKQELQGTVTAAGVTISEPAREALTACFDSPDPAPRNAENNELLANSELGISFAHRLVLQMHGRMWLAEGEDLSICFALPFSPAANQEVVPHLDAFQDAQALVVANGQNTRDHVCDLLIQLGLIPMPAASGAAALELLAANMGDGLPFDLAIIEAGMAEMDGLQLVREIRSGGTVRGPLVMMTSSILDHQSLMEIAAVGVQQTLSKPIGLPDLYGALDRLSSPDKPSPSVDRAPAQSVPLKILVVEDNKLNQIVAASLLAGAGHSVATANDGRQALEAVDREPFDLILMDVRMPRMDGLEATTELRRREADGPRVPVIGLTANVMKGDRDRCLESGMDDYIAKPIRKEELLTVIARYAS